MKRWLELVVLIAAIAVITQTVYHTEPPDEEPLALNHVHPGMTLLNAESVRGQPDFRWPERMAQQWERPFTRVEYDGQGIIRKVEGGGDLTRGGRLVLAWGAPEERIQEVFGAPLSRPEPGEWVYKGLNLWCGSSGPEGRNLSHITLTETVAPR